MAQDHGLCEEKRVKNRRTGRLCRPVLQLPTGQFNNLHNDPGAHGMNRWGQSNTERGQTVEKGSGHGKGEQAHSLQNKATAGGHSRRILRLAQASKQQTAHSWPVSQQSNSCPQQCSAGRWGGVQRCWHSGRRVQTYLNCPYPTYRLCLSLSLPTPLICTNPI